MNRHPDDKPTLIKNEEEWIEYIGSEIFVMRYINDNRPIPTNKERYESYKKWIEYPEEYPCMVFTKVEDVDFRPGIDIITEFFYLEDARDLFIASIFEKAGIE